jgi:hypothetical protein
VITGFSDLKSQWPDIPHQLVDILLLHLLHLFIRRVRITLDVYRSADDRYDGMAERLYMSAVVNDCGIHPGRDNGKRTYH